MSVSLRLLSADGTALHVEDHGGDGPTVLFVHELLGTGATFGPIVDRLRARFRCITFNARGYPPSDVPSAPHAYSERAAWQDVLAVLEGLTQQRAHLVGVSMGAASCLQACFAAPRRVASMVLASIGSGSDAEAGAQASAMEGMAAQFETVPLQSLLEEHANRPNRRTLAANQPESFGVFRGEFLRLSPKGVAATLRGVQKRRLPVYALEPQVRNLMIPALVVLGSEDLPCRKACEFLAAALPNGHLEELPGCGHTPNLEQPEVFARLCSDFIDRQPRNTA
jgi:pimeloyl-ACP methyl ester carboxylesterase